jgi:hypothetical protein
MNLARRLLATDRSRFQPLWCLICIPAVAVPLAIGIFTNSIGPAALMAAGAFSVGFGSFHQLGESRVYPMVLAGTGMGLSSWIGSLAGVSSVATVAMIAVMAFLYGFITPTSAVGSWITQQCAVWLIISTGYPAAWSHALSRGLLVFAGGMLQTAFIVLLRKIAGSAGPVPVETPASESRHSSWLFALRATATLTTAAAIYRSISALNSYWIPMTAIIIVRPGFHDTLHKGFARGAGTLAGAVVATLIVRTARPNVYVSALLVTLFAWICYSVLWVNYAAFALSLTAYVVFLLSLVGFEQHTLILRRLAFTMIGGAVSFVGHSVFRRWTAT